MQPQHHLPGSKTGIRIQSVLDAFPDFSLGVLYLMTWIFPLALERKMVSHLVLVLIMEFIILHSSAFMGINIISNAKRSTKSWRLIGLGLFYTIFVGGFSLAFGVWWPIVAFWGLTLNRVMGIFLNQPPTGAERVTVMASWAVGTVFFLGSAVVSGVVPLPRLGITDKVIALQESQASGSWVEEPQTAMAFGFLYFTLMSIYELKIRSVITKIPQQALNRFNRPPQSPSNS